MDQQGGAAGGFWLCHARLLTSVPGSRDAPRYETNYRYFDFKRLWLCGRIEISRSFVSFLCCGQPWIFLRPATGKLHSHRCRPPDLRRASFPWRNSTPEPQYYHQACTILGTHNDPYPSLRILQERWEVIVSLVAAVAPYIHATSHADWYLPIKAVRSRLV